MEIELWLSVKINHKLRITLEPNSHIIKKNKIRNGKIIFI